jgi:ABC-type antimicrobial peptide transport system permease subunit
MAEVKKVWLGVFPGTKFDYDFYDESIARFYVKEQQMSKILNAAMVIAMFISCMGLFALVTYTVKERTKEIGIRKILGASSMNIATIIGGEFVMLVLLALLIACPIGWYFLHSWLQNFAYRIDIGVWIFVLAGIIAILFSFITVGLQVIKAAQLNPVKNLRTE